LEKPDEAEKRMSAEKKWQESKLGEIQKSRSPTQAALASPVLNADRCIVFNFAYLSGQ